jgi:hypothetical protein
MEGNPGRSLCDLVGYALSLKRILSSASYLEDRKCLITLYFDTLRDSHIRTYLTAVVAGGNGRGDGMTQTQSWSDRLFVSNDKIIYVSDSLNRRVLERDPQAAEGRVVAGGNGAGGGNWTSSPHSGSEGRVGQPMFFAGGALTDWWRYDPLVGRDRTNWRSYDLLVEL